MRGYEGCKKLVHPDDWPAVKLAIKRAHESGDVATEYRVKGSRMNEDRAVVFVVDDDALLAITHVPECQLTPPVSQTAERAP